jgi:hypothetical protein
VLRLLHYRTALTRGLSLLIGEIRVGLLTCHLRDKVFTFEVFLNRRRVVVQELLMEVIEVNRFLVQ